MLVAAVPSQAEWVNGHFRSNGTYVAPYYRTPAKGTPYDNLSYRAYVKGKSLGMGNPDFDLDLKSLPEGRVTRVPNSTRKRAASRGLVELVLPGMRSLLREH